MARQRRTQSTVEIDQLSGEVMKELHEYAELTAEDMKKAVRKSARVVKYEIVGSAPRKTGRYAKSWTTKVTSETSNKTCAGICSAFP